MYADDTTVLASSMIPCNLQVKLQNNLEKLEYWFKNNKLQLNASKTEYILIVNGMRRHQFQHVKISLGGKILQESANTKILGVNIGNELTWEVHTKTLQNKLKYFYRSFARSCRMLSQDSRVLLYNATIASRLNYCDTVWDGCGIEYTNKLQTIQNRCARRILNKPPGTSAGPLLKDLGWINLAEKRKLHKCVLLHRLLKSDGPAALKSILEPYTNRPTAEQSTRGNANGSLYIPRFRTNYIKKSFMYEAVKLWNSIPTYLRNTENNNTFKERLGVYYLSIQ